MAGTSGSGSTNSLASGNQGLFEASLKASTYELNFENEINYIGADGTSNEFTAAAFSAEANNYVTILGVYEDECTMWGQRHIDVMEDESFEMDISRGQSLAVMYHVKAKLAEDQGDLERREFFMRMFNKQLETSSGTKKTGISIIQGFSEMIRK